MRLLISCALLVGLTAGAITPAAAAKRVALVIGNGAYQNTDPLPNPVNDGRDVAAVLRRLGFEVIEGVNQDKAGMQQLLRQFSRQLEGAEASLFFYAGHGLQVDRRNWMVPVDAALESEVDLPFEGVAVDTVLDLMEQTTPTRLVFLDACRDNPLARRLARSLGQSRSLQVGRGLARMNNRVGTLIAFATEPDQVALDGDGDNSPFTEALLEYIETPGLEVRQLMSRVRAAVIEKTSGQQLPLDTSALVEDFYFNPPEPAQPQPATPSLALGEELFWQSIQSSTDPEDFHAYLERYPDGAFAPLARNRLNVLSPAPQTDLAALPPPMETPAATTAPPTEEMPATTPAPPPPPEPEPVVEVEAMDATLVATRNVNIRKSPNTDHDPLGVVPEGAAVTVTGRVVGAEWYRIARPDGGEAYVFAPLFVAPEVLAAAAPAPAPDPAPASVAARAPAPSPAEAGPSAQTAQPAPDAVQTAAIAPGVAAPGPAARTGVAPVPPIDAAALLQTLGERKTTRMRFSRQIAREQGVGFVTFPRWNDVGSAGDAPTLLAGAGAQTRVQTSSETFGEAVMTTQVGPEAFGVVMYSRVIQGGRATFTPQSVSGTLGQWVFLDRHGARPTATAKTTFDGVQFEVAALTLSDGAPARSCLGFVAFQGARRVDGFVCRPAGPAFDVAQANAVVGQIRVPRFIEP